MTKDVVSLQSVLEAAEGELVAGGSATPRTWETGFGLLDAYLGGGIRAGELILLGGPQGLGKTTFALQVMRNVVASGGRALLFSFEHDEQTLLERFLALEAGEIAGPEGAPLRVIREAMSNSAAGKESLAVRLRETPGGEAALDAVAGYGASVNVHRSNGRHTSVDVIRERVLQVLKTGDNPVVVVDYLQKVAAEGAGDEQERVTRVVEGLKDLALEAGVPVLAVVAADREGIAQGKRLLTEHLRGSAALAYEADVVLLLNDKYDVVARHHLVYGSPNADRFRDFAIVTIDKNRSGLDKVDLEIRKRFEQGRFEREARPVQEQLVDSRVFTE